MHPSHPGQQFGEVETVEPGALSRKQFKREYVQKSAPVLLRGAAEDWHAMRQWTDKYLVGKLGDAEVLVEFNPRQVFDPSENSPYGRVHDVYIPFTEAVRKINGDSATEQPGGWYIREIPFEGQYAALLDDLSFPSWIPWTAKNLPPHFWFSSRGCVSPLHFDGEEHNILVQLRGTKEFRLFPPDQAEHLYPNQGSHLSHMAMVNPFDPDWQRFPDYQEAQGFRVRVNPGDMLYVPLGWWHGVATLDVAVSINYWWR